MADGSSLPSVLHVYEQGGLSFVSTFVTTGAVGPFRLVFPFSSPHHSKFSLLLRSSFLPLTAGKGIGIISLDASIADF